MERDVTAASPPPRHGPMEASEADQGATTGTSAGFLCRRAARAGQEVISPPLPQSSWLGRESAPSRVIPGNCLESSAAQRSPRIQVSPPGSSTTPSHLPQAGPPTTPPDCPPHPAGPWPLALLAPGPTSSPSWCPCEVVWCLGTEDAPFTQKVHKSTHTLLSN